MLSDRKATLNTSGTKLNSLAQIIDGFVQRCGSLTNAGVKLKVSHTTIGRYARGNTTMSAKDLKAFFKSFDRQTQIEVVAWLVSDTSITVQHRESTAIKVEGDLVDEAHLAMRAASHFTIEAKAIEDDGVITPEEAGRLAMLAEPIHQFTSAVTRRAFDAATTGVRTRPAAVVQVSGVIS